jgi:hypothetical protein
MFICNLRWSRLELVFVSVCHLVAMASVLHAGLRLSLEILLIAVVAASLLSYLSDRFQFFYKLGRGGLLPLRPALVLGQQSAKFYGAGIVQETALPNVVYMSEFLLVLRFRPETEKPWRRLRHLVLWPDSLISAEGRRLRRFLRFDLVQELDQI